MTINYAKKQAAANRMIKKYGYKKARLRDKNGTERLCWAVNVQFTMREMQGGLVQKGDVKYLISPIGLTTPPSKETERLVTYKDADATQVDKIFKPRDIVPLSPGGVEIYWEFHGQGG